MELQQLTEQYNAQHSEKSMLEKLQFLAAEHPGKVVFTTSFGYEDQVITDIIFKNDLDIKVIRFRYFLLQYLEKKALL